MSIAVPKVPEVPEVPKVPKVPEVPEVPKVVSWRSTNLGTQEPQEPRNPRNPRNPVMCPFIYEIVYSQFRYDGQTPRRRSPGALETEGVAHPAGARRWAAPWLQHHAGGRRAHRRTRARLAGSDVWHAPRARGPRLDRRVGQTAHCR